MISPNDFSIDDNGIRNYVYFRILEYDSLASSWLREANDFDTEESWRKHCLREYNEYYHLSLLYQKIWLSITD